MMSNKHLLLFLFAGLLAMPAFSQFEKGRWAVGGEFSFLNSRNELSQTSTAFTEEYRTGFTADFNAGKFVAPHLYLHGIVGIDYTLGNQNRVINDISRINEDHNRFTSYTVSIGAGIRRYFEATGKVGFFLQGQTRAGITQTRNHTLSSTNDTVLNDLTTSSHLYSINFSIRPGVYINLTPRWQLYFNLGNLYYTQSWLPKQNGVESPSRNSQFGMDVNLFDFRLGVMRFL